MSVICRNCEIYSIEICWANDRWYNDHRYNTSHFVISILNCNFYYCVYLLIYQVRKRQWPILKCDRSLFIFQKVKSGRRCNQCNRYRISPRGAAGDAWSWLHDFRIRPPPFPRPLFVRYVMYATQSYFRPVVRRSWRILYALLCRIATWWDVQRVGLCREKSRVSRKFGSAVKCVATRCFRRLIREWRRRESRRSYKRRQTSSRTLECCESWRSIRTNLREDSGRHIGRKFKQVRVESAMKSIAIRYIPAVGSDAI